MIKVFVDTDVVIDFLLDREEFANAASTLFDLIEKNQIKASISVLGISNVHYICRKVLGDKQAKDVIKELTDFVEIQDVTKSDILGAFNSKIKDFEDAIQHEAACRIKELNAIITRNIKDYRKSTIAVFTPEVFLNTINK